MSSHRHSAPSRGNAVFPAPVAAKVPEITLLFWVIKILTTAGGEATSDYLALDLYQHSRPTVAFIETAILVVGLVWQFRTRRYTAAAYWFLAYAIAIFGTGVSDALHLVVGIPYAGTTLLWAAVLAVVFWRWHASERTLSIHSIYTRSRECYYWTVVFATFALGTALGDFTATSLHLGYLASGILFAVVILVPAVAWKGLGLNAVVAFWSAYVATRPLGASFADYIGKPHSLSGANYGDGPVALITALVVTALVGYLSVAGTGIQQPTSPAEDYPAGIRLTEGYEGRAGVGGGAMRR